MPPYLIALKLIVLFIRSRKLPQWLNGLPLFLKNFRFTFKLWKGITHSKGLNFNKEDVAAFFKSIDSVKGKKGCLLIQFPPSLGRAYTAQLDNLLICINEIDTTQAWKVAVEFRNKSWYHENVYDLGIVNI